MNSKISMWDFYGVPQEVYSCYSVEEKSKMFREYYRNLLQKYYRSGKKFPFLSGLAWLVFWILWFVFWWKQFRLFSCNCFCFVCNWLWYFFLRHSIKIPHRNFRVHNSNVFGIKTGLLLSRRLQNIQVLVHRRYKVDNVVHRSESSKVSFIGKCLVLCFSSLICIIFSFSIKMIPEAEETDY